MNDPLAHMEPGDSVIASWAPPSARCPEWQHDDFCKREADHPGQHIAVIAGQVTRTWPQNPVIR